jgi:hypothetical protein
LQRERIDESLHLARFWGPRYGARVPGLGLLRVSALALVSTFVGAEQVLAADIEWRSSAECDQRQRVAEEAERLIGQPLGEVDFADFMVTIRDLPDRRVELKIDTKPRNPGLDPSSRTLVGASCGELGEAAALAMAMTVSAYQARLEEPPPARVEAVAPAKEVPHHEPLVFSVGASAALDAGAFPKASVGAQVRISLRYRWLSIAPIGVFFPRSTAEAQSGTGAQFRSAAGGLLACAGNAYRAVTLDGCVGYELGKLSGRGTGLRQPRAGDALWSAARAEVQLGVPLFAQLLLTASAGVSIPTARERFEIEGGLVHRPGAVTGRFGLGLEVRL